jgi:diguanylate cyclase (GGDEF)-like protein
MKGLFEYGQEVLLAALAGTLLLGPFEREPSLPLALIWTAGLIFVWSSVGPSLLRTDPSSRLKLRALLAGLLTIHAATQLTGGIGSPMFLLYLVVILVSVRDEATALFAAALSGTAVLEGWRYWARSPHEPSEWRWLLVWAVVLIGIPSLFRRWLAAERQEQLQLKATVERMQAGARAVEPMLDLDGQGDLRTVSEDGRMDQVLSASHRFEDRMILLLQILCEAVRPSHRAMLFICDPAESVLRLHTIWGGTMDSGGVTATVRFGEGLIGWLAKESRAVRLGHLQEARQPLPDPLARDPVRSLMAVPLRSARGGPDRVEGLLVLDSLEEEAFGETDERLLHSTAQEVALLLQDLRESQRIQSRTHEMINLLEVSKALSSSRLDLRHRLETMADLTRTIAEYDHCFICLVEPGERRAAVKVARGYSLRSEDEQPFALTGDGLIGWVVKNRHPIILTHLDQGRTYDSVFPKSCSIRVRAQSFLGLPLLVEDRVIGVFALTSRKPGGFTGYNKHVLSIVCNQAALSIADAQLHEEVERLATTDGLTGLLNHRRFQERLIEEFERHARQPQPFSILMMDVDHFKKINDRFGHPVGDQVLRRVAEVLTSLTRKVDSAARYGGEEFVVMLVNTDRRSASKLAERIRLAVERMAFEVNGTRVPITLSVGVATYPNDTGERSEIVGMADKALYLAKKTGRNRVCLYDEVGDRTYL